MCKDKDNNDKVPTQNYYLLMFLMRTVVDLFFKRVTIDPFLFEIHLKTYILSK